MSERRGDITSLKRAQHRLYLFLERFSFMSERRGNITSLTHAQHLLYLFLVALLPDVGEKG